MGKTDTTYTDVNLNLVIDTLFPDNTTNFISPAKLRQGLKKILKKGTGSTTGGTIGLIGVIGVAGPSYGNVNLSTIKAGDDLNGYTLLEGDVFAAISQTDPEENGIYVVGANPGETVRNEDYPTADSLDSQIIVSFNAEPILGKIFIMDVSGAEITTNTNIGGNAEITNATAISNITSESNWNEETGYTGPTTNLQRNQYYIDSTNNIKYETCLVNETLKVFRSKFNNL